ncbi:LSM domain containing protein [Entamoeba nuttalli P19]|uniref:LSM domain containing protein n=1 Tax=Entamoeba nuttalli (strain P19) TaxID=1076696 RepID=K2HIS3_ENTNP|nr:LSM domain containing protein [Entamoeba nuttalli P19]EKE42919.1 LSM domain containing protein [Entamoeba nuttalli P19]|eukprot:XP_008854747.1 LSM domain containing protein [Entamoeba nuttalli P19]
MSNSTTSPPIQFFKEALFHECSIKLNDGTIFKGKMTLIDGLMNIVLENAIEYINGNKDNEYPECFIRGNNSLCY